MGMSWLGVKDIFTLTQNETGGTNEHSANYKLELDGLLGKNESCSNC